MVGESARRGDVRHPPRERVGPGHHERSPLARRRRRPPRSGRTLRCNLTLTGCTVSGNTANGAGNLSVGGGVTRFGFGSGTLLTVDNCALNGNWDNAGLVGAIAVAGGTLGIKNTILNGQPAHPGPNLAALVPRLPVEHQPGRQRGSHRHHLAAVACYGSGRRHGGKTDTRARNLIRIRPLRRRRPPAGGKAGPGPARRLPRTVQHHRGSQPRRRDRRGEHRKSEMVGAVRFELTTSCTRNKRASQATLRPDPIFLSKIDGLSIPFDNLILPA